MNKDLDKPIDWSSFDEPVREIHKVPGCLALKILCAFLCVVAVVGLVVGFMKLGQSIASIFDQGSSTAAAVYAELARGIITVSLSFLTFFPAAFGFSLASQPNSTLAPVILGVLGIVTNIVAFVIASSVTATISSAYFSNTQGSVPIDVADLRWAVFGILAVVYLIFTLFVRRNALVMGISKHSSQIKEELWDEDKIWNCNE